MYTSRSDKHNSDYLNINPINKVTTKHCQSSIIMSSKKQKRTLPEADSGLPHTSKMELSIKNFHKIPHLRCVTRLRIRL